MKHEAQVKRTPLPTDTEGLFQGWVVHTARERGYLVQITLRRMRRGVNSQPGGGGWPDLMFVGRGRVFWAELKTTEGYLKPDQVRTIEVMRQNGAEVFVWTPADYETVLKVLS